MINTRNNKSFISTILIMLLLFLAVFGSSGCGGGHSSNFAENTPIYEPDPEPIPTPEPTPDSSLTVTFHSNGGSAVPSKKVELGGTVTKPDNPIKDGNIFVSWYKDNNDFKEMFLFGSNGDKVTQDITLYAQWIENDPNLSKVQYAISQIALGYSDGDNSTHVTNNLTLPTNFKDENLDGVIVAWSSSNVSVVGINGTVIRPQNDTTVKLTATVSSGATSQSKEFEVNVIRANTRAKSDIHNNTITEIENMNLENDEFYIGYNSDRTQVTNIEGKYSNIVIENADDALDAIQNVHSILGIADPYNELQSNVTNSDSYGAEYSFTQYYNGVRVYGRKIMASANASGEADFLRSNLLATEVLDNVNMNWTYSQEQAENAALGACAEEDPDGDFTAASDVTQKIIYSIGTYETSPVYAYIVRIYGTLSDGTDVDGSVFVNAHTNKIIDSFTNIRDDEVHMRDELGNNPKITVTQEEDNLYLYDPETKVRAWTYTDANNVEKIIVASADTTAVSAYKNMIDIIKWWKTDFNRNSIDGNGINIHVIVHNQGNNNAFWTGEEWNAGGVIIITEFSDPCIHSRAVAPDVIAHESTHGVLQYIITQQHSSEANFNFDVEFPYRNATGAINEGYADILGCVKDTNWLHGERLYDRYSCTRNISDPGDGSALSQGPERIGGERYFDYTADRYILWFKVHDSTEDNGGVHTNSFIISHAAYLMHRDSGAANGLDWQALGQVWYRSMYLGNYGATTDWQDVRSAVVIAARKMNLDNAQINCIKNAFTQVGIEGASGRLTGKITAYETNSPIIGATVRAVKQNVFNMTNAPVLGRPTTTDANGEYSLSLEASRIKYVANITATNYVEFSGLYTIEESEDTKLDVALVKAGTGSGSVIIRSAIDNSPLGGVTLKLRKGWNYTANSSTPIRQGFVTNADGLCNIENIDTGYYTVEITSDDYTTSYTNITIAPGVNPVQNGYLSPILSGGQYQVVLSWGENPNDLDSHLEGRHPEGSNAHVYFSNKSGSVNGKSIYLDRDDTDSYGPETTTFDVDPESNYEFYVVWYSGYGTWKGSDGVVNVYNGTRHVAVYPVPNVENSSGVWSVFRIRNGIFTAVNEIVPSTPAP